MWRDWNPHARVAMYNGAAAVDRMVVPGNPIFGIPLMHTPKMTASRM